MNRILAAAVFGGAVIAAFLAFLTLAMTVLPTQFIAAALYAFLLAVGLVALSTVLVGVVVSAFSPPLTPVAEMSILGKRAVAFVKFGLAVGTFFGTALVGWMVVAMLEAGTPLTWSAGLGHIRDLAGTFIGCAAIVYWYWLSVDLLRLKKAERYAAIDRAFERVAHLVRDVDSAAYCAKMLVTSRLWVVSAFYFAPLIAGVAVLALAGVG